MKIWYKTNTYQNEVDEGYIVCEVIYEIFHMLNCGFEIK